MHLITQVAPTAIQLCRPTVSTPHPHQLHAINPHPTQNQSSDYRASSDSLHLTASEVQAFFIGLDAGCKDYSPLQRYSGPGLRGCCCSQVPPISVLSLRCLLRITSQSQGCSTNKAWVGGILGSILGALSRVVCSLLTASSQQNSGSMSDTASLPSTDPGGFVHPTSPRPENQTLHSAPQASSNSRPVSRDSDVAPRAASSPSEEDLDWQARGAAVPTWPKRFESTMTDTKVSWQSDGCLHGAHFNLFWEPGEGYQAVLFRLVMRVKQPGTRKHVKLYILIPTERIRSLTNTSPRQPCALTTRDLSFVMWQPPVLVAPKSFQVPDSAALPVIGHMYDLARQLSFTVTAKGVGCTQESLDQICAGVSASKLRSIERFGLATLTTLYEGKGGQVLHGPSPDDDDTAPPAYDCKPEIRSPSPREQCR